MRDLISDFDAASTQQIDNGVPGRQGWTNDGDVGTPEKPNSNPNPDSAGERGNSNWRGPIWIPVNGIVIRALVFYFCYDGKDFQIEFLTGSGNLLNLDEVAEQLGGRLVSIFLPDAEGRRPVFDSPETFQHNPYWKDHLLFDEYFHGNDGAGIGASHQTGWTGMVANLMNDFTTHHQDLVLEQGPLASSFPRIGPGALGGKGGGCRRSWMRHGRDKPQRSVKPSGRLLIPLPLPLQGLPEALGLGWGVPHLVPAKHGGQSPELEANGSSEHHPGHQEPEGMVDHAGPCASKSNSVTPS